MSQLASNTLTGTAPVGLIPDVGGSATLHLLQVIIGTLQPENAVVDFYTNTPGPGVPVAFTMSCAGAGDNRIQFTKGDPTDPTTVGADLGENSLLTAQARSSQETWVLVEYLVVPLP